MGQSTDAILFYGFHADEGEWDEQLRSSDDDTDWESAYAAKKGEAYPDVDWDTEDGKATYRAYAERKRRLVADEPCEVDSHCSGECPMPFVCIAASKTTAWRGSPVEIKSLEIDPKWDAQLRAFCEFMGIPWQEPKWWLVSDWN